MIIKVTYVIENNKEPMSSIVDNSVYPDDRIMKLLIISNVELLNFVLNAAAMKLIGKDKTIASTLS